MSVHTNVPDMQTTYIHSLSNTQTNNDMCTLTISSPIHCVSQRGYEYYTGRSPPHWLATATLLSGLGVCVCVTVKCLVYTVL